MTWSEVLDELNAGLAEADEDLWYHLTAMGMTERSLDEAKDATDLLASHVPNLRDVRVADLGCGVGRHLVDARQRTKKSPTFRSNHWPNDQGRRPVNPP